MYGIPNSSAILILYVKEKKMRNSIKLRLIICSIVLFTTAVGINVFLNSSSVDRLYEDSTISQYGAIGGFLKTTLTEPLKSGQKIHEIKNIQTLLAKTREGLKQVSYEEATLSNIFTISQYRTVFVNFKNQLINLFISVFKILGINNFTQIPSDMHETLHSDDKKLNKFSSIEISSADLGYAVSVALPNNIIAASTNQNLINSRLPEKTLAELKSGKDKKKDTGWFPPIQTFRIILPDFSDPGCKANLAGEIALIIPRRPVSCKQTYPDSR